MIGKLLNWLAVGDGSPVLRWLVTFLLVFTVAFAMYLILLTPLVLLGLTTYGSHLGGAIGCGIGTALVNATFILLF